MRIITDEVKQELVFNLSRQASVLENNAEKLIELFGDEFEEQSTALLYAAKDTRIMINIINAK